MKRFSGFISIFSIALVLFLISMNQFGRIFEDDGGTPKPSWIEESQQGGDRNQFTFRKHDRASDTLQFEVTGDLVDTQGTGLDITNLDGPQALRDAEIRFPLQRDAEAGADSLTPMTELLLHTGLIQYDSSHSRLKLIDGITGEGDDGTQFETSALDIRYDKVSRKARLSGVKPIRIAFPAVQIFGRGGFTGEIDTRQGLDQLRILPPVVVALDRSKGGGLLGIRQTQNGEAATEGSSSSDAQIFLLGDGPLTINRVENRATFHDHVRIFEAPKTATIENPPEPGDTWFSCEELQLAFDSATLKFTGATALRGDEWVTVHLPDSNKIRAGRLQWLEGSGEVVLDEGIEGAGELVNFRADQARLFSFQRRCELSGNVTAEFQRLAKAEEKNVNPRTLSRWKMTGTDRAELTWLERSRDRTERGRLESFRATAMIEHGLEIVEDRENGARLAGTSLIYDGAGDTLRLVGSERATKRRPTFAEGRNDRNRIQAEEIALALTQPELVFTGLVDFVIHDFPEAVADPEVLPAWIRDRGEHDHARGTCHEMRLLWDENHVLQRVVASADTDPRDGGGARRKRVTPISFQLVGARRAELTGTRLSWAATDQQIRLRGLPGELNYQSGALSLAGEEIRFDTVEQTLDATDPQQVRLEVLERRLLKPDDGAPGRTVVISSPNLHVQMAERSPEETAAQTKKERVTVEFARAWDHDGDFVEISDGVLVAMGQEVLWNAKQNVLELKGDGRQRILHLEGDNDDELSAKSITVLTDKRQVILDGDVRGSIHQQPPGRSPSTSQQRADVPWRVEASSVTATVAEVPNLGPSGRQPDAGGNTKTKLVLDEVDARGRIRVSSPDGSVSFEGSACSWRRSRQTLVIKDPADELALQTLRYGSAKDGLSDVRAREIRVTRNPGAGSNVETLWVFLTGDVVGNFQTTKRATSSRGSRGKQAPTTMRLLAENLLAEFRPQAAPTTGAGKDRPLELAKVSAWKGVNFLAGETCVLADRTVYTRAEETLVFSGKGRNKVQLIEKNVTSKTFEQLALRQRSDGRYSVKASGGDGLSGPEIWKILELLDQQEKAPKE